ncbi:MAG: cell division protein FtsL [Clostridia bacterium]|nr:cell division protein FtsL [Clostridia bacterium]
MAKNRSVGTSALYTHTTPSRRLTPAERRQRQLEIQRRLLEQARRIEQEKRREKARRLKARKEALKKTAMLVYLALVFSIMGTVVLASAYVADLQLENNRYQAQIDTIQKEVSDLELQLSMATDLHHIRIQAEERLGMSYPKPYQVRQVMASEGTQ